MNLDYILNFINSIYFIIAFLIIIILLFLFIYILKDRRYIKKIRALRDIKTHAIEDLKELPLVNIIIPAWKEGEVFRGCLTSITKLSYPNLKVILNVGGSEETINIANSFKKYENFLIINQKSGEGKLKAINDALNLVTEGLIYLIDADVYLSDNIFNKMIYVIVNEHQNVVVSWLKPHRSLSNKDLVKFIYMGRIAKNKRQFLTTTRITTQNTCFRYEVLKLIGKFPEKMLSDDNLIIGNAINESGYEIYIVHELVESFNFPDNLGDYYNQNMRWVENYLMNIYKNNKKWFFISFFYTITTLYLFFFPFLIFLNFGLFSIGIILLLILYLNKIRKFIYYKNLMGEQDYQRTHFIFFFKLLIFIYTEIIINFLALLELVFYKKRYKRRKNIS